MNNYLIVTDYLIADGKTDAADAIQKLIDENPHRTLFFPDGEYHHGAEEGDGPCRYHAG